MNAFATSLVAALVLGLSAATAAAAGRRRHASCVAGRPAGDAGRRRTSPIAPTGGAIRSSASRRAAPISRPRVPNPELDGARALGVDEISVRGIVATGNGYVAMVKGPNGKTFVVRPNDKLLDGTVKSITAQAIVFCRTSAIRCRS